jgi:hypothetical protein
VTEKQSPVAVKPRTALEDLLLDTRALLDIAEKPYLLPLILFSCCSTLCRFIPRVSKSCLACLAEVVNDYYEFKAKCSESKAHFEQASMKRPSA